MLYLKHATQWDMSSMSGFRRIDTKLGFIDSDTDTAELHVKLLLRGIAATAKAEDYFSWPPVHPVDRIEIFSDDYTEDARYRLKDRGIVLFDVSGRPLVHVCHALIGYGGSGPSLTEAIFQELGVDEGIFDQIQKAYSGIRSTNTPYYVVVQKARDDANRPGMTNWHWSSVRKSIWG